MRAHREKCFPIQAKAITSKIQISSNHAIISQSWGYHINTLLPTTSGDVPQPGLLISTQAPTQHLGIHITNITTRHHSFADCSNQAYLFKPCIIRGVQDTTETLRDQVPYPGRCAVQWNILESCFIIRNGKNFKSYVAEVVGSQV